MNYREIVAKIEEGADVQTEELPIVRSCVWFPQRTPMEVSLLYANIPDDAPGKGRPDGSKEREVRALIDGMRPTVFRVNNKCPLHPALTVVSVFGDEEQVRVYCAPLVEPGDVAVGEPHPATLYTLSLKNPVYTLTIMSEERFLTELQAEWSAVNAVANGLDPDDDEDEDEEDEEAEGDDEEEPEGDPPGMVATPAAPTAPVSTPAPVPVPVASAALVPPVTP